MSHRKQQQQEMRGNCIQYVTNCISHGQICKVNQLWPPVGSIPGRRYQQIRQKSLQSLSGTIFVNSVKIQLWQHKVAPFLVEFLVLFFNLDLQMCSRNVCHSLQFSKLVLEGEIGQNLAKLQLFKVKNHAISGIKIKSLGMVSPLSSPQNDLNAPK